MEQAHQFSDRLFWNTGQAARHRPVSILILECWLRDRRIAAFKTPGEHCRIEPAELQHFLRQYGMRLYQDSVPDICILIVDDEPCTVGLFVALLAGNPRGFHSDTATDEYDALMKIEICRPSVLILDVLMPYLDGIAVYRHLKVNPDIRAIKILGIMGYPHLILLLLEAGADLCLPKPL